MRAVGLPTLLPLHKELILSRADKAHTLTVVAAVPIVSVEAALAEAHAVRVVTIFARSRPVVAGGTDAVDICPVSVAHSGQEDCSVGLKLVRPVCLAYAVAAEASIIFVGVAQAVCAFVPVVWQKYHAIHSVNYSFRISYPAACASFVKNIHPLVLCESEPTLAATVRYCVVAGTPTEQVYPAAVARRDVFIGITNHIPLGQKNARTPLTASSQRPLKY